MRRIALGAVLLLAGVLLTPATPAMAAVSSSPVAAATVADFKLRTDPAIWQQYAADIAGVQNGGAVQNVTATDVAISGERTGRNGLCHATPFVTSLVPDGFCWDHADDTSNSYNPTDGGWTPQGLTSSHDSDNIDGTINGRHLYMASWHFGINGPAQANLLTRVSIVHNTATSTQYGHVLLVRPAGDSFTAVTGNHGDGLVWYGNRLFVANGRELQVYDTRHIWRMTDLNSSVGITEGRSSAKGHRWVMPMIGRYWTGATPDIACSARTGTTPCLNSLSLDRSGADGLVSTEYTATGAATGARVIRWPLNHIPALPRTDDGSDIGTVTAVSALTTNTTANQGAATYNGVLYLSAQCETSTDVPNPTSSDSWTCIYKGSTSGGTLTRWTRAPRLTQNLSFSQFSKRLWGINERINTGDGVRMVFSLKTN
ncbi:hypothetical protein [Actinoplanes sp. G11-F43]|uniref:hypothetical protein n=1 Tax=Actinoplanes sp. G11-F43 TaxID=3424130 RepID=UPI003D3516CF